MSWLTERKLKKAEADGIMSPAVQAMRLLDDFQKDFEECKWDDAAKRLETCETILTNKKVSDHKFQEEYARALDEEKTLKKDVERSQKLHDHYYNLKKAKSLTIKQLIELVHFLGTEREYSEYIEKVLFGKRIVFNKKGYRILRYRGGGDQGHIMIEGFQHIQVLENEMNKGWVPVDEKFLERVFAEQGLKAVRKLDEKLPLTPEEFFDVIDLLRTKKTPPEVIKADIIKNKPLIIVKDKAAEHGARVNYYIEKDNTAYIHFEGWPGKLLVAADKQSIEKAVGISHLLAQINEKLTRLKPFGISNIMIVKKDKTETGEAINSKLLAKVKDFSAELTEEEIAAMVALHETKGIVAI
jgi:hypothetical protein